MTKKKIIIIAVVLLVLLVIFSIILARTEEFSVKAFSLFGVMVTGYGLVVLGLFSIGSIGTLPLKRRLTMSKNFYGGFIIIAVVFSIIQVEQIISAEEEITGKYVFGLILNTGLAILWLVMGISGRMQIKKELLKLSEEDKISDLKRNI